MQVFSKINLDLLRPAAQVIVHAKQNDKAARFVQANLWEGGQPFTPSDALAVFRAAKPDGAATFYDTNENGDPAIVIDGNVATIELVEQVLTVPGDVTAELNLYTADGEKLTSFTFTIRVQASVLNDVEISSSDYFNVLTSTLTQAQAAAERAEAAAGRAEDLSGGSVKSVNGQTPDNSGAVTIDVGVLEVNGQSPDDAGAVSIDVGVMTVNNQAPDENGNVNVQAGVSYLPNILDNTDFSNPINQKGETSYSGTGYGIDRWTGMSRAVVELVPGGVQLSNSSPAVGLAYWQQLIEPERLDYGNQPYSIGVKINGTLYCASGTGALTVSTNDNINITYQAVSSGHIAFRITLPAGYTGQIVVSEPALYPGTFTKENFPLFTRPNYAEELAKCQRYFVRLKSDNSAYGVFGMGAGSSTTSASILVPIGVQMRAKPAVVMNGNFALAYQNDGKDITAMAVGKTTNFVVSLDCTASSVTAGRTYILQANNNAASYIDFDANL